MPVQSRYFLITLILFFLGLFGLLISGFLTPIILGLILTALTFKWYKKISELLKGRENIASLITLFLIILIVIIPLTLIIILLSQEAFHLFITVQEQTQTDSLAFDKLHDVAKLLNLNAENLETQILTAIRNFGLNVFSQLSGILSNVFELAIKFFVMLVIIFYLFKDGKSLGDSIIKISPLNTKDELYIYETFKEVGRAVFYGNFISALAQGILGGIGFWLFGLASPLLWGVTMAFLALIPLLGPYIIFLPAAAYLYLTGKIGLMIGFLLYNFLLVSSIDNIIKPKLIGDKMKVHPFLVLISILGGLNIFGLIGIIYGPLIIVITITLIDIYNKNFYQEENHN